MSDFLTVLMLISGATSAAMLFIGYLVAAVTAMGHSRGWAIAAWLIPGSGLFYCAKYRNNEKAAYPLRMFGLGAIAAAFTLLLAKFAL